jgi:outer membrane protein OmpA-like peptidoglycan-associated protein
LQSSVVNIQQGNSNILNQKSEVTFTNSGAISVSFTYVASAPTASDTTAQPASQITVSLSTASPSGQTSQLENMSLVLTKGDAVNFSTGGLKANSEVSIYIFSDPRFLGKAITDKEGKVTGSFPAPDGLPIGNHTIQLGGYLPDGTVASISLPLIVKSVKKSMSFKVYFPMGSAILTKSQINMIEKFVAPIRNSKNLKIVIQGFVQKTAQQKNDALLAKSRALTVAGYLKKSGTMGRYLVRAKGYAVEPESRARRVEITITE